MIAKLTSNNDCNLREQPQRLEKQMPIIDIAKNAHTRYKQTEIADPILGLDKHCSLFVGVHLISVLNNN